MDFTLPDEVLMLRDTLRKFVRRELEPISEQVEEDDQIPDDAVAKMADPGLFGLAIPEEQRRRYLPELASGRIIGVFALSEPKGSPGSTRGPRRSFA